MNLGQPIPLITIFYGVDGLQKNYINDSWNRKWVILMILMIQTWHIKN